MNELPNVSGQKHARLLWRAQYVLADVYDALVKERSFKKHVSHEDAVVIIAEEAGKHFDPRLVEAFLECADEFECISRTGDAKFPTNAKRSQKLCRQWLRSAKR